MRHVAYPRRLLQAARSDPGTATARRERTGPQRRKCPASLTFLTPQPLTMNQAWELGRVDSGCAKNYFSGVSRDRDFS